MHDVMLGRGWLVVDADELRLRPEAAAWQSLDEATVVLDLRRGSYAGVNRSGTVLWSMLAVGTTHDALVERLVAEFDVVAEQAEHDVDDFVAACRSRGYLR